MMDEVGAAIVHEAADFGLVPFVAFGVGVAVVAVLCAFVLPVWRKTVEEQREVERMRVEAQIDLDRKREEREAAEAERKAAEARERAEIDGRTAVLLEGLKTSIDALVANQERVDAEIKASRTGSQRMGETVDDTNRKVSDLHRALLS